MPDGMAAPEGASGNRLFDALTKALENLTTLQVTTVIGTMTAENVMEPSEKTKITDLVPIESASLSVNMVLGDANQAYTANFAANAAYMKLHTDLVATARAVRQETFDLIKKGAEVLAGLSKPA